MDRLAYRCKGWSASKVWPTGTAVAVVAGAPRREAL